MPQRGSVANSLNCSLTVFASGGGRGLVCEFAAGPEGFVFPSLSGPRRTCIALFTLVLDLAFESRRRLAVSHMQKRAARAPRARARPVPGSYLCRRVDRVFLTCSCRKVSTLWLCAGRSSASDEVAVHSILPGATNCISESADPFGCGCFVCWWVVLQVGVFILHLVQFTCMSSDWICI